MAQNEAPNPPQREFQFIDIQTGLLTSYGLSVIDQLWRQVAAGFAVVPCACVGTDALALTPILHVEGARTYGDYMAYSFTAENTSTGAVTAAVGGLASVKVYITGGDAQAGAGDIVANRLYLALYSAALDTGAGGLVLFASA